MILLNCERCGRAVESGGEAYGHQPKDHRAPCGLLCARVGAENAFWAGGIPPMHHGDRHCPRCDPPIFEIVERFQIAGRGDGVVIDATGRKPPEVGTRIRDFEGYVYDVRGVERPSLKPPFWALWVVTIAEIRMPPWPPPEPSESEKKL